jgi:hypothetical protein
MNECSVPLKIPKRTPCRCEDFLSAVGNCFHNCQLKNKKALGNFEGLSQDEGQADFAKNITVSSINGVLSNDQNFQPDLPRWTVPLNDDSYSDLLLLFSSLCKLNLLFVFFIVINTD